MNIYWEIKWTLQRNTETLTDASKEVDLEIKVEKSMYILLFRHKNAGQNREMEMANRS
jgi:hypothetical protein